MKHKDFTESIREIFRLQTEDNRVPQVRQELAMATAHSCRISGARLWAEIGLAESTIMVLGDWRSLKILQRYIGTASVTGRMRRDLARALSGEGRTNPSELVQTARRELMPESRSARLATKIWQKDEFDGHHRVDASADSRARSTRKWLEKRSDLVEGRTATRTGEPPHTPALVSQRCPHRCVISGAGVACSGDCGHRRQHLGRCLCPACFNDEADDPWWPAHRPATSASDFVVGRTSAGETTQHLSSARRQACG